ncbi:MAG: ATP-binding cassette domain-containing protein [Rhizobiales bacterium]|nr:ATP-binding cassette domain-containing protein [Hyphomicrobiales bacterium]
MTRSTTIATPMAFAGAPAEEIIRFDRVSVRFGDQSIFEDLSFSIRSGEFVCILGPSGCGKSTILRLIGDLLPVAAGTIEIAGAPPHESWDKLAYVFQSPRLVPWRTAFGNVMLGVELRRLPLDHAEIGSLARTNLEFVGLARDAGKYPRMLSGGERQRVAIARALTVNPLIILMDEPFSALDVNTRQRLRTELLSIWRTTGKTIVFVTHDIDEALILADRILLLSAKPTRILEAIEIGEPRPRRLESGSALSQRRDRLVASFEAMETQREVRS